jgi:WD40 repeat protein
VAVTPDGRRAVSAADDYEKLQLWNLESGKEITSFTGESGIKSCAIAPDGRTINAFEALGRVHFLRLVEADETKPAIGETKIRLLSHSSST